MNPNLRGIQENWMQAYPKPMSFLRLLRLDVGWKPSDEIRRYSEIFVVVFFNRRNLTCP